MDRPKPALKIKTSAEKLKIIEVLNRWLNVFNDFNRRQNLDYTMGG